MEESTELMTLVELQKFIADELASSDSSSAYQRAFLPLTDGLGLESPRPSDAMYSPSPKPPPPKIKEVKISKPPEVTSVRNAILEENAHGNEPELPRPSPLSVESTANRLKDREPTRLEAKQREMLESEDTPPLDPLLKAAFTRVPKLGPEETPEPPPEIAVPPPMPVVSFFRRAQSVIVDYVFIFSLWIGSLLITSHVLTKNTGSLWERTVLDFSNPLFLKCAALEFVALWVCYYAFCVGLLDMTLGMWVWGLKLTYTGGSRGFKKILRIIFSLVFIAPVVPLICLAIRRNGRNLLDWVSGTKIYRTTS